MCGRRTTHRQPASSLQSPPAPSQCRSPGSLRPFCSPCRQHPSPCLSRSLLQGATCGTLLLSRRCKPREPYEKERSTQEQCGTCCGILCGYVEGVVGVAVQVVLAAAQVLFPPVLQPAYMTYGLVHPDARWDAGGVQLPTDVTSACDASRALTASHRDWTCSVTSCPCHFFESNFWDKAQGLLVLLLLLHTAVTTYQLLS